MKTKPTTTLLFAVSLLLSLAVRALAVDAYESAVQSQSPVGYWRLNDNVPVPPAVMATNLGTLGTNGYGTFENDMLVGVAGALPAQSSSNTALRAKGYLEGNRVRVPFQPAYNTNAGFSVEFWCKPGQTNFLTCPVASAEFADPSTNQVVRRGWLFYQGDLNLDNGNGWLFRIYNPPSGNTPQQVNCSVTSPVDTNKWYHIVGTYKPANPNKGLTLYTNGVQAATANVTAAYENVKTNTIPLTFGARADGDFGFFTYLGDLDEGAFYPAVLTAAQVLQHYQAGTNNAPATAYQTVVLGHSPSGYWRFNEKPGPTATNLGSSALSGEYLFAATNGVAGPQSPAFTGFSTTNKAVQITTNTPGSNTPGSVRTAPLAINTNTVTMTAWIKPNGAQNPYAGIFMAGSDHDATYSGLNITSNGGFQIGYTWGGDPLTFDFPSTVTVPDGQWSFVAVTVSSTQAVIYAHDGTTFQTNINVTPHLEQGFNGLSRIGMDYFLLTYYYPGFQPITAFNGGIDEVSIFKRELSMGEVYSLYAVGKGGVAPSIFRDVVAPASISAGETLSLSVDAGGSPNLSYRWRKNGSVIGGATTNSYTKANMAGADNGNYDVVITNAFGTVTSAVATINIQSQTFPSITTQPLGRTVYRAGYVNLSVVADGGNLKYRWRQNGSLLAGGTNASYIIAYAQGTNAGTYTVIITNSVGSVTSAPAVVTVIVPAAGSFEEAIVADNPISWWRLDEAPSSPTFADAMGRHDGTWIVGPTLGAAGVVAGSTNTAAQFTLATGSYGEAPYGSDLNGQTITVECWVKTANISDILVPVSSWVAAPNKRGYMFVKDGPNWNSAFSFGDDFIYTYIGIGSLAPNQWTHLAFSSSPSEGWSVYKNGVRTDGPFSAAGWLVNLSGPFRIGTDVPGSASYNNFFDGTIDEVAVYNTVLPANSILAHYEKAKFGAGAPPIFLTQPASQTVAEGLNVTFAPVVEGSSPFTYAWSKGGSPIAGETNLNLTLTNITFGSVGSYALTVSNAFGGTNSQPVTLAVVGQPTFANLTNNLVMHLKFDGNYSDSTGRGNHGTNVGTTLVAGKIGSGALSYSTTTNPFVTTYVDLGIRPDLQFGTGTDFSVAFWAKFAGTPGDLPFLANSDSALGSSGYTFAPSFGGGGAGWSLNAYRFESAGNLINNTNWHHVLVSVTRTGNIVTYVDGTAIDSRFATTEDLDTGFNTVIGQGCFFDYAEAGSFEMDDLGVWRRALTPSEAYTAWYVGENYSRSYDNYGPVLLDLRIVAGGLQFVWQAGTLEQADSLNGPWTAVGGATAPTHQVTTSAAVKFFRVRL